MIQPVFIRWNRIIAGSVLAMSLILYFSTMASTVSFWDCGEFIATSYTLGVPHPPGSPLFLIIGRFFSMLPFGPDVAWRVNTISPIVSAVAVMLVYLIIVKLIVHWRGGINSSSDALIAIGSALVGALTFAVTDSHWFNAVEAEVYAMSTFFTAIVVWLILHWSERAEQPGNERYILIIAYMIGLATGIHLLNLLALPFIALIMYFRKQEFDWKSFGILILITGVSFLIIHNGIIKGLPKLAKVAGTFGVVVAVLVMLGLMVWSVANKRQMLSLIFTSAVLILVGYSSYTVIFIRSNQNPSIDENNPETVPAAISYLEREQYGKVGVFPRRYNGLPPKHEVVGTPENGNNYSRRQNQEYATYNIPRQWSFFWGYQVKKMYWRYFLWQFAGRGPSTETGITDFGANRREDGVDWLQFGLPLAFLLGLLGMAYHFYRDSKEAFTLFTLFFFTGLAVILYLNQDNPQPRERDYSYVGSFLAFSLWVGIGAAAIMEKISEYVKEKELAKKVMVGAIVILLVFIPGIMLRANYHVHDRSGNFVAWDMSYNFLQSCEPNAIIFTNGDNDTFPLWYLQEVEGIRKDVTVANLSLLNTPWYIKQLRDSRPPGKRFITLSDRQIDEITSGLQRWQKQKFRISAPKDTLNNDGYIEWELAPTYGGAALKVQDLMILRIINDNKWRDPIYFAVTVSPANKIGLDDYLAMEGLTFHLYSHKTEGINPVKLEENLMTRLDEVSWSEEYTPTAELAVEKDVRDVNWSREYQPGYLNRNLDNPDVYYNPQIIRLLQNYRSAYMQLAVHHYFEWQNMKKSGKSDSDVLEEKRTYILSVLNRMEENIPEDTIPMDSKELYYQVGHLYGQLGEKETLRTILNDLLQRSDLSVQDKLIYGQAYFQNLDDYGRAQAIFEDLYASYGTMDEQVQRRGLGGGSLTQRQWKRWQQSYSEIVGMLVMAYREQGLTSEAITVLQEWLNRFPDDKSALQMLESLQAEIGSVIPSDTGSSGNE